MNRKTEPRDWAPSAKAEDAPYEEVEHTADWAFQVRGGDLRQLFVNAAQAMFGLERASQTSAAGPLARAAISGATVEHELRVEGVDRESLLVNWLNELLYLAQKQCATYEAFDVFEIGDTLLRARVSGRPEGNAHRYIKAVTFHNLGVKQTPAGWEATVVVDV